jgi:hypothetical protein
MWRKVILIVHQYIMYLQLLCHKINTLSMTKRLISKPISFINSFYARLDIWWLFFNDLCVCLLRLDFHLVTRSSWGGSTKIQAISTNHPTIIYDSRTMKQHAKHNISAKWLAFQYDKGLVTLVPVTHGNKVVLWDIPHYNCRLQVRPQHSRDRFRSANRQTVYTRNLLIVAAT